MLASFLRNPSNSVSRERIFFHKLYFDLKLAAARRNYHLTLFEPEVDRDAYDIILDDGDVSRRIQLKTVLGSAKTCVWYTAAKFFNPESLYTSIMPMSGSEDSGHGGAFVVIQIDDGNPDCPPTYLFSDFYLQIAFSLGLVTEAKKPKAAKTRAAFAVEMMGNLHRSKRGQKIKIKRKHFVEAKSPDALLALLGLHSNQDAHMPLDKIMSAYAQGYETNQRFEVIRKVDPTQKARAEIGAAEVLSLISEPGLQATKPAYAPGV